MHLSGNQDKSSQYSNYYPHEKDKQSISDKGNSSFLYGTEGMFHIYKCLR